MIDGRPLALFTRSLSGGGAERATANLANELVSRGYNVDLVLQYREGPYLRDLDQRVRIHVLERRVRSSLFRMRRYLRTQRPQAMISFLTEPNVLAAVAWRLSGMDGALAVSEQTSLVGLTKSRRIAIRFAYPLAREVVAVSSAMADELVSHGVPPDRIRVIPNPTSQQALSSGTSPLLNGSGGPIVVGVGRLVEQKDFATLIRAFEIVQRDQDVRLLILGEGPERQRLEDLAASLGLSDKIEMPGFINNPWPLMAQASVFALSSRWEGWPNVLAEALALGLPVVSTDCPTGPNEILDNGKYGLLVPIQDPPALAAAIAQTLQDPPPSASLQQRAQKWSVENITDQYLQALNLQPTP